MNTIALFYSRCPKKGPDDNSGYIYNRHPQWRNYPHELMSAISDLGNEVVLVGGRDTYVGQNTFSQYWLPVAEQKGLFRLVNEPVMVDAIFNKGYFEGNADFSMVNVTSMCEIGRDKSLQSKLFSKWQPKTLTAQTKKLSETINEIPGKEIVVKPTDANGGKGVIICTKDELLTQLGELPDREWVVQEFIDSRGGIPGLFSGVHDLRIYVIDGECALASVRHPQNGKLVANTSQGGSIEFFPVSSISNEPVEIVSKVDEYMKRYGNRYYSVDFITNGKKWYLLEINDRPGVPAEYQSTEIKDFHKKLAKCIVDSISNPLNKEGNNKE